MENPFARANAGVPWNDEHDIILKKMYVVENKDINEIGVELKRSPLTVALRLVTLDVIENREHANGYSEFYFQMLMRGGVNCCPSHNGK
jgi:hypothetical protein